MKIDPEFKSLIPPLSGAESTLIFSRIRNDTHYIGISPSKKTRIDIYPTKIGRGWIHYSIKTLSGDPEPYEKYTESPVSISRALGTPSFRKCLNYKFKTEKYDPVGFDFFKRKPVDAKLKTTNIYIIQSEIGGPVKIGKADDVDSRLEQHQIGCPVILNVVKVYSDVKPSFEKKLHKKFIKYRLHGEWFSDKILDLLEGVNEEA